MYYSSFLCGNLNGSVEGFFIINPPFVAYLFHNHYLCHTGKIFFQIVQMFQGMSRGRSSELITKRNEALLRRYYYWTEIQRLRFDDALKILSEKEFFISVDRIMAIIRSNCNRLKDIDVKPVPKIKKPRLTAAQLSLFTD